MYVLYHLRGTSEVEALSNLRPCPPSRGSRGDASEDAQVGQKLRIQCLQMQVFFTHSIFLFIFLFIKLGFFWVITSKLWETKKTQNSVFFFMFFLLFLWCLCGCVHSMCVLMFVALVLPLAPSIWCLCFPIFLMSRSLVFFVLCFLMFSPFER